MLKKITFLVFLFTASFVFSQNTNELKKSALRDANKANEATLKGDYKTLLTFTHKNILDAAGGTDVMQKYLETTLKEMKANGFKYEKAETKSVSNVVKEQGEYRCFIENYNQMVMGKKRIFSTSYMLGIYNDLTEKWVFVEAKEMKPNGAIIAYFPDFKTSLNIPENTMKTEDI